MLLLLPIKLSFISDFFPSRTQKDVIFAAFYYPAFFGIFGDLFDVLTCHYDVMGI